MSEAQQDIGASVRAWTDVVRRARLGKTVKYVAYALAQYADADGRRIFPGIARLSFECELSYNVIKSSLQTLRKAGLIEVVRHSRQAGKADEYRLILDESVYDRVEIPSPGLSALAIEKLSDGHRRLPRRSPVQPTARAVAESDVQPTARAVQPVDNSAVQPMPMAVEADADPNRTAHAEGRNGSRTAHLSVHVQPTAWAATSHRPTTTTTNQTEDKVETAVTGPRETSAQEPESSRLPMKCSHGLPARRRGDGSSSCALCRTADRFAVARTRPHTA